jgi:hypothetical protein
MTRMNRAPAAERAPEGEGLSEVSKERWLIALYAVGLIAVGFFIIASL